MNTQVKTKKIGIFVDSEKTSGGAYQELLTFIKNFEKFNEKYNLNFTIVCTSKDLGFDNKLTKFKVIYFSLGFINRYIHYLFNFHHFFRRIRKFLLFKNKFESFLDKNDIDYLVFTGPSQYPLYIEKTNFCMIVPDVNHRENNEFPELSFTPEYSRKDEIFTKSLPRSTMIIANSQDIKKRISFFYKILEERIIVINQQPSESIKNFNYKQKEIESVKYKEKKNLPENYVYYPAMYLPHKNHKYIIDGIKKLNLLKEIDISAVFCGSDKGYLKNLKEYAKKNNIDKKIIFLNFVNDDELPFLYINSKALVMPTLMGPTNIPPWEAFKLNVPVFYTDFKNIKSVLKDAVYYIDPLNPDTMVEGIKKILTDENFKKELIAKGSSLINSINEEKEYEQFFENIIKNRKIRERWIFN